MKKKTNKTMSFPNIVSKITWAVLIFAVLCMQTACNESGSGGLMAGGGIGGTGISVGEISGFGSVVVNDVDFDTSKAEVFINGTLVGKGDLDVRENLALGMVVRVEGQFLGTGTGKADRIVFNEYVKGPVSSVETLDTRVKKITVLSQVIIVDGDTIFKGTDFNSLKARDLLQISGWTDGYGVIQATYVALVTAPKEGVTVKGIITEAHVSQGYFLINQQRVDFTPDDLINFPEDAVPKEGQLVAARGYLYPDDVLTADEVRLENDLGVDDAQNVEIEGIVSQVYPPSNFDLGTTPIITDKETAFIGIALEDIFSGLRLLIKGSLTEGHLLADEVIAKDKVNLEGTVESVDSVLAEISLLGLNPLVIHVNDATKIFGDAAELIDVRLNQHVKILGYVAGQDKVEAAKVKVEKKASDKVKLQGPVSFANDPIISVFSIEVYTGKIDGFETAQEGRVSRRDFFNLVDTGDTVSANGNLIDGAVEWKAIELLQE